MPLIFPLILSLLFTFSQAKEYPKTLDKKFQDNNHDLIADTPKDASKWIDPPTLVFSYAPHESPTHYQKKWKDFLAYLSKVTQKPVVYFPYQTNTAQLEAMKYGKLHICGFATGMTPLAVNYAGFHPFAIMGDKEKNFGYKMEIITYANSPIQTIEEIQNKTITMTNPSSNSGYKAPLFLLKKEFHLENNEDFNVIFSGSHENSIKGIANHKYTIAAVASSVKNRMIYQKEVPSDAFKILFQSDSFPTTAYGYAHNLSPSLIQKIRKAFLTFPWSRNQHPSSLKKAFYNQDCFLPISYKSVWKTVREMQP